MLSEEFALDVEREVKEIPPEYQDIFRQALARELAESEQDRTDQDILVYLRRRREECRRGSFIRPDGRPGLLALEPEALYEQGLPALARQSAGAEDDTAERRRTLVKLAVFAGVAVLFVALALRGRAGRSAAAAAAATAPPAAATGVAAGAATPAPTPPLPAVTGGDDTLQTIGGLGGALTLGRPSAIELHYGRTGETIALAIDPSRPTTRGELRYDPVVMASETPVAVWIFGTVLNYALGVPESLVRNLAAGDRLVVSTDTGASLAFVVAETGEGSNYETGRLLSQNRLGLTLFALPAVAADAVAYAAAHYDVGGETAAARPAYELGEAFDLGALADLAVTALGVDQPAAETLRIVITGTVKTPVGVTPTGDRRLMLSLSAGVHQTAALEVAPDEGGQWAAVFTLPAASAGQPLVVALRALPGGALALVGAGEVSRPLEALEIEFDDAVLEQDVVTLTFSVHNPGPGSVVLAEDFIQLIGQGGDAADLTWQTTPRLPRLLAAGETLGLSVAFRPPVAIVQVQTGADLWEVGGLPASPGPAAAGGGAD